MRILVTNDDGIDSIGLHMLARAMTRHGDVVVVAPDREYSGAGAAIGALHLITPEVRCAEIQGIEESWSVSGAPALCVFLARLGAFGKRFDLVVSGINPGNNVGRAVYHSGTVGAVLTARTSGMSGVAVSQAVAGFGVEGQGWDEMIANMQWDTGAEVASRVVEALLVDPPEEPVVINLNVPNVELDAIKGWQHAVVGTVPPRSVGTATLQPIAGQRDTFSVSMGWGDTQELDPGTDGGAVERGQVSITYLSPLQAQPRDDLAAVDKALETMLGEAGRAPG